MKYSISIIRNELKRRKKDKEDEKKKKKTDRDDFELLDVIPKKKSKTAFRSDVAPYPFSSDDEIVSTQNNGR